MTTGGRGPRAGRWKWWTRPWALLFGSLLWASSTTAGTQDPPQPAADAGPASEQVVELPTDLAPWQRSAYGVTRRGDALPFWFTPEDLDPSTQRLRILLIAPLDGGPAAGQALLSVLQWLASEECPRRWRQRFAISVIPWVGSRRGTHDQAQPAAPGDAWRFPPPGPFYGSSDRPEANYLWRWLGTHAPDLVVELREGRAVRWRIPPSEQMAPLGDPPTKTWGGALERDLQADRTAFGDRELPAALGREAPSETGVIPVIVCETPLASLVPALTKLLAALESADLHGPSPARLAWRQRLDREPLDVLRQLSRFYGQTLPAVEYIPAMALVGRLRLGTLANDPTQRTDVLAIVAPYLRGEKPSTPKSGSGQSGHLIFTELARGAEAAERTALIKQARLAADQAFAVDGAPLPSMPFHLEMSDAFFMGGPVLAATGRLTGQARYFDACHRHLEFMTKLDLRADGLYRHSPLDETAWGRGNGFVALGIGLCLSDWPVDRADRRVWVAAHDAHLRTLLRHQDPTGCWHQVVDRPESYRELSSTCMITWAMARGVREGWLDRATYDPAIRRAWRAILQRVAPNGRLIDICTGTGKQKSLREYYDREAILGLDPRGGAMAMIVAAEMAEYLGQRR